MKYFLIRLETGQPIEVEFDGVIAALEDFLMKQLPALGILRGRIRKAYLENTDEPKELGVKAYTYSTISEIDKPEGF